MELRGWINSFKALHERARKGDLSEAERPKYIERREELARALVTAQRLSLMPGQTARMALRVARALQLDLELVAGKQRVVTMNLSTGGCAALLPADPGKAAIGFSLKVPNSNEPLVGRLRVVDVQKRTGNYMVSFAFVDLSPPDQERLESMIFDIVLQQFEGTGF